MKRGFVLFIGLFLTLISSAQNVSYQDSEKANTAKLEGVFNFNFDGTFSKEKLDKATTYYAQYFEVEYQKIENGYSAKITMLDENPISRKIIERYFTTLNVKLIEAGEENLEIRPFIKKYLMLPTE